MKSTRNLWPYGIIATFVVFGLGMTTLVTIAAKHPEDLVSDNYYEHELQYQNQIDGTTRALAAGAAIRYDTIARQAIITLPVVQLAQKLTGTVVLYRPDSPALDRTVELKPSANGTQTVSLSQFAQGPWRLKIAWQAGGQGYYLEKELIVPAS